MGKIESRAVRVGDDGVRRCWWCGDDPLYVAYHDQQWGWPVDDDRRLFEKICLEGFQAGLSWLTILRKRVSFREAFAQFDLEAVARFGKRDVNRLVKNAAIVRHRGKIESTINNANRAIQMAEQFGSLASYVWQFEPALQVHVKRKDQIPSTTEASKALSKDLKQRGWSFVGPTTCYAFMQAIGMVNDHLTDCAAWRSVDRARKQFERP